jgi:hypothetical protein
VPGKAVELEGLRRLDAAVLIAVISRGEKRPLGLLRRTYVVLRYRVRGALRRLEDRGLIEPGWSLKLSRPQAARVKATPEGVRAARAAAVVFELEAFAGPVDALMAD